MKLKFDAALEHQLAAIDAVVGVFDGLPLARANFEISQRLDGLGLVYTEQGVGNAITLDDARILANVRAVQERNNIEMVAELEGPASGGMHFTIEMETGTGKTYVYLRTIFELNKHYGFKKFIIVVPSIAVREGVQKSIEMMGQHLRTLYQNVPFKPFVYDSGKLEQVSAFARDTTLQIMIINIQSFQREANIFNQEHERSHGYRPRDLVRAARPIVIIDEPQNMEGARSAEAMQSLEAAATLRYSATHRRVYNLLYKLDPVRAYDLHLVKQIEVASIRGDGSFNDAYVKLLATDNARGIKAQVALHRRKPGGEVGVAKRWLKLGDNLFAKSGGIALYRAGYIVQTIDCTPGAEYIEFNQGTRLALGQERGGMGDEVMQAQVATTVERHLERERALKGRGIKVLSLFFIDRVANYRVYNEDGSTALGKIGRWFEEAFAAHSAKPDYRGLIDHPVANVHGGYFSQDKHKRAKDTRGNTVDDEDTYALIMREKERLLDPAEPLRFIFSHSALREGWDNPNVFQICTLNESKSPEKKRQEIGRGLRLAVGRGGERVHDESINRLTIIANESYEDFARTLQTEIEEECGVVFGIVDQIAFARLERPSQGAEASEGDAQPIGQDASRSIWHSLVGNGYLTDEGEVTNTFDPQNPHFVLALPAEYAELRPQVVDAISECLFKNRAVDVRKRRRIAYNKRVQLSDEFQGLWQRIKQRTRYRVEFKTETLIEAALRRIAESAELTQIQPPQIVMTHVAVEIRAAGVQADKIVKQRKKAVAPVRALPDLLAYLQKETELTRSTLGAILTRSGSEQLGKFRLNPQAFMTAASRAISRALHTLMIEGIRYEKLAGEVWQMSRIEGQGEAELTAYLHKLYKVQNSDKSLFDFVECDSEVERRFAKALDDNEDVKLFIKLPRWFTIDTPIGPYNPDWAFVTHREERLYFVRETKGTLDSDELRAKESEKIKCGEKHFKELGVNFAQVTKLDEVVM